MIHPKSLSMKTSFEEVEERLSSFSAEELRGILYDMARQVDPNERGSFLQRLKPPAHMAVPLEQEAGTDDLLHDIADFEEILRNEMKSAADDYDRHDRYDDESGTAHEDLTGDIEELFDRAQAASDLGQYHTARNAYGSLHSMLREEDEYGRSIAPPESVDLDDARARYLHALLMTTAPPERPKCLLGALRDWEQQAGWWRRPTVREVFEVGSISKPEREAILSELVGLLSDSNDLAGDRWLRDATRLLHGREGIGQLAKLQGCRRPHAYLDWLEEIAAENDPEALLAAARETLGLLWRGALAQNERGCHNQAWHRPYASCRGSLV